MKELHAKRVQFSHVRGFACNSRMSVCFLTRATCKKVWHKSYTSGHCLLGSLGSLECPLHPAWKGGGSELMPWMSQPTIAWPHERRPKREGARGSHSLLEELLTQQVFGPEPQATWLGLLGRHWPLHRVDRTWQDGNVASRQREKLLAYWAGRSNRVTDWNSDLDWLKFWQRTQTWRFHSGDTAEQGARIFRLWIGWTMNQYHNHHFKAFLCPSSCVFD